MKKLLLSLLAASLFAIPAHAQETKAQLNTDVSTNFPDNTTGLITPAILRTTVNNMIASWQQTPRVNAQVGASYALAVADYGYLVTFSNASPVAVTLPQATGSFATWNAFVCNKGAGAVTITPSTSTIGGAATLVLQQNQCQTIVSDGANYQLYGSTVAIGLGVGSTKITGGTTSQILYDNLGTLGELGLNGTGSVCMTTSCALITPALGVATASTINGLTITAPATGSTLTITSGNTVTHNATTTFSGAAGKTLTINNSGTLGGADAWTLAIAASKTLTVSKNLTLDGTDGTTMTFPSTSSTIPKFIASGAKALATGAIGSAACTAAQTDTATGTLTTDAIIVSFNADPTGTTGYVPLTSGMLTIIAYPTADTVNFKVCNNTGGSITPGAVTLNWRVIR